MTPLPSFGIQDSLYPQLLRTISHPPDQLYYRSKPDALLQLLYRPLISIVGTRKMTSYGKNVIRELVPPLVRAGCVIVSGLALGCDGEAHRATIEAGGETIAIVPGGVDDKSIAPQTHLNLAQQIIEANGCIMSEFPPGSPMLHYSFPVRNRIIAGLCKATIVIEAEIKSGSLITGKLAAEFGREVFAVPGPIHAPFSTGTNYLIQCGAHLITSANDVLERLGLQQKWIPACAGMTDGGTDDASHPLLKLLSEPRDFDALVLQSKLAPSDIMTQLSLLEIEGKIVRGSGVWYRS